MKYLRANAVRFVFLAVVCLSVWQTSLTLAQQPAPTQTPQEIKINPQIFDAYVGQYEDAANLNGIIFSFSREGEKYLLQATNQDKVEIFPSAENKFFLKITPAEAEFVRDANGRVTAMIWRQGGREFTAKKIADQPAKDTRVPYKRTEAMIPMRDGVKLYTVILAPENQTENLPILINRTPYGVEYWNSNVINAARSELVKDGGYIFVFQDIRGRNKSEGEFVMIRPPRDKRDAKSIDESTDVYDTIDYLVKNTAKNNGRVGIAGVSYDGFLSSVALLDPHPALKVSSPQAPMTDVWMGDDFFHNGAFRQSYAHEWGKPLETAKSGGRVTLDKPDSYDWYFDLKTLSTLTAQLGGKMATWNNFVAHPNYDEFWQARAVQLYLKETSVPTLIVGGWWDQEDLFGPLALYQSLEKTDRDNQVFLVMGPWNHGGWSGGSGRRLGDIDFGSDTGKHYRQNIETPFLAYHLKGKGTMNLPEATIFRSGSNKWMSYDSWTPRRDVQKRNLYLQADGKLSFDKPTSKGEAFDTYISDPANPVPYRKRPIPATYSRGSGWFSWLVQDQRFLADRKDVLTWQSEPLTEDVTITGDIIAHLFAATTGTDSDWIVKLINVYPENYPEDAKMANYQLMVASEALRGRFRKSFSKPEPIKANAVNEYTIDLRGNDYTFKKGHRIMVQVQSSWFPLYDRNPQKYVDNIFLAKESDFQAATQRVYRSAQYPSHISVSVATR